MFPAQPGARLSKAIHEEACTQNTQHSKVSFERRDTLEQLPQIDPHLNYSHRDLTHVCPSERWPRNLWMQLIHTRLRGKRLAKNAESVQEEIVREREQQAPDRTRLLQQRGGQTKGLLKNPAEEGWSATKLSVCEQKQRLENAATLCRNMSIERSSYQDGAVLHLCSCLASWRWEQLCLVQAGQDKLTRT